MLIILQVAYFLVSCYLYFLLFFLIIKIRNKVRKIISSYQKMQVDYNYSHVCNYGEKNPVNSEDEDAYNELNNKKTKANQVVKLSAICLAAILLCFTMLANSKCRYHQKHINILKSLEGHSNVATMVSKRSTPSYGIIYGSNTSVLNYYYPNKTAGQTYVSLVNSDVYNFYNIHSHNDEWRAIPLFGALSRNYRSVEADCHYDGYPDIYVGHAKNTLQKDKTLQRMYLGPMKEMLDEINNYSSSGVISGTNAEASYKGLYQNFPSETLNLLIDIKDKHGHKLVAKMLEQLEPMREYLTYYDYNAKKIVYRPISITFSGNCPVEYLTTENGSYFQDQAHDHSRRYVFIDHDMLNTDSKSWNNKFDVNEWCVMSSGSQKEFQHLKANSSYPVSQTYSDKASIKNLEGLKAATAQYGILTRLWGVSQSHSYPSNEDLKQTITMKYGLPYTQAVDQYYAAMNSTADGKKVEQDYEFWRDLIVNGGITLPSTDDLDFMVEVYNRLQLTSPGCKNFS